MGEGLRAQPDRLDSGCVPYGIALSPSEHKPKEMSMDFIKVYERIRERGMDAEWGTLNNGLPQISVRVFGITFFIVPDHFPGYEKAESDFICLRTFMPMETVSVCHKAFLDAAFNKIASNVRLVKIYSVENDGTLYAFFEVQALSTPEDFIQRLTPYANECVRAIKEVAAFVNSYPSLAEG